MVVYQLDHVGQNLSLGFFVPPFSVVEMSEIIHKMRRMWNPDLRMGGENYTKKIGATSLCSHNKYRIGFHKGFISMDFEPKHPNTICDFRWEFTRFVLGLCAMRVDLGMVFVLNVVI